MTRFIKKLFLSFLFLTAAGVAGADMHFAIWDAYRPIGGNGTFLTIGPDNNGTVKPYWASADHSTPAYYGYIHQSGWVELTDQGGTPTGGWMLLTFTAANSIYQGGAIQFVPPVLPPDPPLIDPSTAPATVTMVASDGVSSGASITVTPGTLVTLTGTAQSSLANVGPGAIDTVTLTDPDGAASTIVNGYSTVTLESIAVYKDRDSDNESTDGSLLNYELDRYYEISPTVSLSPPYQYSGAQVMNSGSPADAANASYSAQGASIPTVVKSTTWSTATPGSYSATTTLKARDGSVYSASVTIVVSNPIVPISSLTAADSTYTGSAISPPLSVAPAGATFDYTIVGGTTATTATLAATYTINWTATGSYSGSGTTSWRILPRAVTVTLGGSKEYDGTTNATGISAILESGTIAPDSESFSFKDPDVADVGSYVGLATFTASNGGDRTGNYTISYQGSYAITPKAASFSLDGGATSFVYDTTEKTTVIIAVPAATTFTVSGVSSATDVGDYTVTATATGNYTGTANLVWHITKAPQIIDFPNPGNQTMGTPLSLAGSATSALPIAWSVTGPATLVGNTLTFTGEGNVTVTADQAGDGNWSAAPRVSHTLSASKIPVTFSLDGGVGSFLDGGVTSFVYDTTEKTTTVIPNPASATFTTSGVTSATNVGEYAVTATATGNYTGTADLVWRITKAPQVIDFPQPDNQTLGTPLVLAGSATSALPITWGVSGPATLAGNTLTFTGEGSVIVTADQPGDSNWSAAPRVSRTISVAKIPTTFSLDGGVGSFLDGGVTSFVYDTTEKTTTVIPNPASATFTTSGVTSATNVGEYTVTVTATGNYSGIADLIWRIIKAPQVITFNNPGVQHLGTPLNLAGSATSGLPITWTLVSGPATLAGSTLSFTGAGPVVITADQPGDSNWLAAPQVTQSIAVSLAAQTIVMTPDRVSITAGESVTYSAFGGQNGYVWGISAGGSGDTKTVSYPTPGPYDVSVYSPAGGIYAQSNTVTVTINAQGIPITGMDTDDVTYNRAEQFPVLSPTPAGATFDFVLAGGTSATGATDANTYVVTWTASGAYTGTGTLDWTIAKADQTIIFAAMGLQAINVAVPLVATASSGLPVTFSVTLGDAFIAGASISSGTTGSARVEANQVGDSNWNPAPPVERFIAFAAIDQSVTLTPPSIVVAPGENVEFNAMGGNNGYIWGGEASGNGPTKTISFPSAGIYYVTVYSPAGGSFNASPVVSSEITVKVFTKTTIDSGRNKVILQDGQNRQNSSYILD